MPCRGIDVGYIPEEVIAQVLDRTDIVEIVGSYIPLKPAGRNFKALSPFTTEKTPSFIVSPEKQIFHCFSTGKGGNVISFVMFQERMTFPEAVRFLAQKAGIEIPDNKSGAQIQRERIRDVLLNINRQAVTYFHQQLISSKSKAAINARDYLKSRGITLDMVNAFKIGFAPDEWDGLLKHFQQLNVDVNNVEQAGLILARKNQTGFYDRFRNRIVFPIFDYREEPVAFGARTMSKDDAAKYINSPETSLYVKGRHLYGFQLSKNAVAQEDHILVVEGYLDFIVPFQAGVKHCVASLGTALTVDQIRLIRRYTKNITMLFDTDKAGQAAMLRSVDLLIEEGMSVKIAQLNEGEDPDSYIRQYGVDSFREHVANAQTVYDFKLGALLKKYDQTTIEGRAHICQEMLPTLQKYDNEVIKSEYIRRLARELGIRDQAVFAQEKQTSTMNIRKNESAEQVQHSVDVIKRTPEWQLLSVVVHHLSFLSVLKQELALDDINESALKQIYSILYNNIDLNHGADLAQLIQLIDDVQVQSLFTELLSLESLNQNQSKKIFEDCLKRIKSKRHKIRRQYLLDQIRQAEQAGNDAQVELLQQEFKKLVMR